MSLNGKSRCSTARLEIRKAEYAAINTNDVIYDVKIVVLPVVFFILSGIPVTHKQIRIFNTIKGTVPASGREDRLNDFYVLNRLKKNSNYLTDYVIVNMNFI